MSSRINHEFSLNRAGVTNAFHSVDRARHRWYYYKEGFSPLLVEKAIELTGLRADDVILDPFNGSGTTTLTAAALGFDSVGIEVNPFTSFLSNSKTKDAAIIDFDHWSDKILSAVKKGRESPLKGFSTFSQTKELSKWLFNDEVLSSFEGGWKKCDEVKSYNLSSLLRLALISSAMQNCNAKRDGKCLRYRPTWIENGFDKATYHDALEAKLIQIKDDFVNEPLGKKPKIIRGDSRNLLTTYPNEFKFRLCITSPPYLNTFDYTDIYRPELFLGRFIRSNQEMYKLRLQTIRSHIQAKWKEPEKSDFGPLYQEAIRHVKGNMDKVMDKRIPSMIQAYFEDISGILRSLRQVASNGAQLWLIVSNSAYADKQIPVDLIIGDIGANCGWYLKDIAVLENIRKRKTRHSPNIDTLRESVVIFSRNPK